MINIISYSLYLIITFYITIVVGWKFYKLGLVYLKNLIKDTLVAESTNRILLMGYYLVNLGYAALKLNGWKPINNYSEMISVLSVQIGVILLTLCMLHYCNMGIIYLLRKKQLKNHKNKHYGNNI